MAKKICVLGAGSWGTALANHLSKSGFSVSIWGRDESVIAEINSQHKNSKYFPNIKLDPNLQGETLLARATEDAELIVSSVPSPAVRKMGKELAKVFDGKKIPLIINTAKGLEEKSLKQLSVVLTEELGEKTEIAVLSGPSFAREVIEEKITAVTIAGKNLEVAEKAAQYFHQRTFRAYTSDDLAGVEYGGAFKNVIALAVGIVEGYGIGLNGRAALITRGLAELQRLVVALGGKPLTIVGLSGLGDLILTTTGDLSRNRQVGLRLGKGEKLAEILKDLGQVAEGVKTAPKMLAVAEKLKVPVPICEQVNLILENKISVSDAVKALLSRSQKTEGF